MANCKFCGKAVISGLVVHRQCWESELEKAMHEICDGYCQWPKEDQGKEELKKHCVTCPLIRLVTRSVWVGSPASGTAAGPS